MHTDIFDLPTPALLLDRSRLERNAARMQEKVHQLGVTLRPHVKTSKSIDVLRVLAGGEDVPITVSTLAEARYFFAHGVTDILYAVGIAPVKLPEVADLIRAGCKLRVILDTVEAAAAVRAFVEANDVAIEALIEIDSDGHRAGVAPDDPLLIDIGRTFGDQSRGRDDPCRRVVRLPHARTNSKRWPSRNARSQCKPPSACALRACLAASSASARRRRFITRARLEGVTEARAGVYAFGDLVQAELGTCAIDDIAIGVLASVIGHNRQHGRVLIDAGFLALSRDRGTADLPVDWGYGAVCDPVTGEIIESVTVSSTNQEHGIITARCRRDRFRSVPASAAG